jgi:hypothetical protein
MPFDRCSAYERIIDDIEQLQEMFEAPDIRPLSASDISAANRSAAVAERSPAQRSAAEAVPFAS